MSRESKLARAERRNPPTITPTITYLSMQDLGAKARKAGVTPTITTVDGVTRTTVVINGRVYMHVTRVSTPNSCK